MNSGELIGSIASLWRYPVKSMQGREVEEALFTDRGLTGDRAFGLVDVTDGTVVSAKNPRRWPGLLDFRADYAGPGGALRITLPDATTVAGDAPEVHRILSRVLGRPVELRSAAPAAPMLQQLWPGDGGDVVTEESMPPGTFFDLAPVHVLSAGSLEEFRRLYPDIHFDVRRFRPNVVIADGPFTVEAAVGRTLCLGANVRLHLTAPTARCVMTTFPQPGLPAEPAVLRAVARQSDGILGVYGVVIRGGLVRQGDSVRLASE